MKNEDSLVYLIIYHGQKLPPYYIGSTYKNIWESGYYGQPQSKLWKDIFKKEFKEHPELFDRIIIQEHQTRKEALEFELFYQKTYDVINQDLFYNESCATKNGCFGNRKMSIFNATGKPQKCKGRVWCNNGYDSKMFYKDSIPDGWVLGRSQTDCKNISKQLLGQKKPNFKWITNGQDELKHNIHNKIPDGWVLGRSHKSIQRWTNGRVRKFHWYQNDIKKHSIRIYENENIPENYYLGRTYYKFVEK